MDRSACLVLWRSILSTVRNCGIHVRRGLELQLGAIQPSALSHSPAVTEGSDPTTVVSSRCPRTFTRRTQKPLSSLWKVTRSMTPEICSVAGRRSGIAAFIRGDHFATDGWGWGDSV